MLCCSTGARCGVLWRADRRRCDPSSHTTHHRRVIRSPARSVRIVCVISYLNTRCRPCAETARRPRVAGALRAAMMRSMRMHNHSAIHQCARGRSMALSSGVAQDCGVIAANRRKRGHTLSSLAMRLYIYPDAETVGTWAAQHVVRYITKHADPSRKFVLGLPTGESVV